MDDNEVIAMLRSSVADAGGVTKWAKVHGMSHSIVSEVHSGSRPPTKQILDALGLTKVAIYKPLVSDA